mgnify:CR=1 FL=1
MGFRDLLTKAVTVATPTSCIHGILNASIASENQPLIFDNIIEAPGHRAALNLLERSLLCQSYNITPSELMDIMLEAMLEPEEPLTVANSRALECEIEVVLENLPIPWHHPEDAGRYMSASIIIAQYEGIRNVSFHRQLIIGKDRLAARLVPRHLKTMLEKARINGDEIPIAIVNAPDASVLLAAAMSFNHDLDELTVASALHRRLNGEPLSVVVLDNGIMAPADAEYIMQARLTAEVADEGPYVDITGTVDEVRSEPVIIVDSINHAKNPVMHVLIPGFAEHRNMMGLPRAPAIKDAVNKVTECIDVFLNEGGCGWLSAVVAINPRSETDAVKAINAAFSGHPSMKQVTIVNSDIDVTNPVKVEWAMMTRWQPDRDTVILSGQKGSSLDPSRNKDGTTAKVGFDATLPFGATDKKYLSVL